MTDPRLLTLSEADQLTLVGLMLRLMAADISEERDDDVRTGRRGIRNQLRYLTRDRHPDGRGGHDELAVETPAGLQERLGAVASEAHGIQLLVEGCSFQPWQTPALAKGRRGRLDGATRLRELRSARDWLPGNAPTVDEVERGLFGDPMVRRLRIVGAGVGVAAAGFLTAGVAAPVIGGAIGGTMGLSGAAAVSAGLAWLGGGSLAAGGFGMAGGTTLIAALGTVGGSGLGTFGARQVEKAHKAQLDVESQKLKTLIRLLAAAERGTDSRAAAADLQLVLEQEIAALLQRRIAASAGTPGTDTSFDEDVEAVTDLRRRVGVDSYPLRPC